MASYSFIAFFVSYACFLNYGSSLNVEPIIGGYPAEFGFFPYYAAIIAKEDHSNISHLICGGAIIAAKHVLTAAQCFIDGDRQLRELTFSIIAGTNNLHLCQGCEVPIRIIYVFRDSGPLVDNDIALAKLKFGFDFSTPYISKVNLPDQSDTFTHQYAIVSGSGYNWVRVGIHHETRKPYRNDGFTDYKLRYGFVFIDDDAKCNDTYENVIVRNQMCGRMLPEQPDQHWGVCTRDTGSPLVVNNTIVGVLSRNTPECDDTNAGAIYVRVAAYLSFIACHRNDFRTAADMYTNRIHIPASTPTRA